MRIDTRPIWPSRPLIQYSDMSAYGGEADIARIPKIGRS